MIDNLLGSLDYTAKLPIDIKVNTDLPKFRDLTPVNINNLLADNQKDEQLSFDDLLRRNEQKYGRTEKLNKPYFINRYEYERYINSDKDNGSFFNWKPNPIFKNPLYFDNEELNAQQQSGLRQFINGTSKALPSMISSFVEGLNPIPGTKEGEFQKWIHDWSKQLEYTHPNYYSKQEKDNPFAISTILDGNFWGDKVLKNAGFTIGAIGGVLAWDAAISAATLGSGTAPATAIAIGKGISMISKRFSTAQKLINGVNEASMVGKAIKSSNLAYEGLKNYSLGQKALTYSKLGFLNYVGSNSEASIEGYEGLESLNDELISEFIKQEGRKPEAFEYANIKDIARQMANTRYSINLPLLMITNAIEFGSLFSPSKLLTTGGIGFGERLATDAAGKIFKRGFKDFTVLEKLGYIVTNPLVKNFLAESFQEGTQYSIEKATRDLGFKKFQNPNFRVGLSEYMESQALGIKKTFSETEGLESMLIGGITGAITTGFTSSWDKFISKQSEKESKILDETINEYNALTEEGILDSKYFKDYMTRVVERDQINFDGTLTHLTIEAQIQKAIEDKNVFAFKALQHDKLFNLVSLATRLDKLDAFKLKIEQLRGLSTEELAQNLGIQNLDEEQTKKLSEVIDEYVDLVQNKVEQMSDIIKVVNNSLINNFDPEKDELKFHAFNDLKNTFAFQLSNISDIKGRISEEMDNLLSDKMNPLSESLINTLLGQEESEQTLIIDDFTKNFVSEKGFDLSILDNKYAKPYIEQLNALNSEISTLNLSIESAKAAKLPYEGYKSKLNQKKKQLADFLEFLSEFNNKIQTFSETLKNSQDFTEASNIDAFKDLTSHVLKYEMNKDLNNPISISKADEIVEAIADLHLLNSSLKLFINDNNKFQTPKGQSEYLDEYIKWKSFAENKVQEAVRKANFETLKKQKPESINLAKSQISSNISEIEEINAQLQILNEQLIEAEDKEPIQKQIDELKAKKEELKKQNEELEKVADALENDKELDEDTNLEKRKKEIEYSIDQLEKDIEDRKKELIKNGASEKDAEKIARKEFNESDGGKNKIALEKLYGELDKINNQLEQKDEDVEKEEKQTETSSKEVMPIEIETTTPKKSIDLELESKEDEFITQIDKQEFNGRVHFLRTTDVEIYDKPEKDGKGGRTRRFQLFLEQFLISNGLSQVENLNNWLSNNNLKFVIMRPTDEMYDDRTFDEKYKALDNQSKSAVLVLVDKDNKPVKLKDGKIDESGDFIAEVLPTKKEKSKWNDQLQYIHDSEYKQLHNAVNSIKSSENPSPITVNITGVADGLYRFMTDVNGKVDKNPSPLTKSILDNPASELFVNTSSEDIKFGGFTLQRGKLYLKVSNEDKTYFYFPIQLGKISETKLGNSIHSILEYVFKNHKTLKEENDTLLKDIDLFLETVLYNGVKINNLDLEINFHLNSENPYFKIERVDKENKTQTLLYDLDSLTSDKKLFLNFLKGLDINSKTFDKSEQIEVPILDKNGLRIEKQLYKDFLLENTTPTIPFKIDLSKGFDRVKQALFFNIDDTQNSLLEDTQSGIKPDTGISELVQSEIEAKKADIERRRQEELNKANKQIEKTNKKEDRRLKVETYRTLDIGGNPVEVEITTNADGSRLLRARQVNEDGSIEPMAYATERINNKSQATLTNEKLIEGYIGNEDNTLQRTNVDENPNQTHIDKINAKYDAEYVDAVKKGEMTKEQAMQALEQAGRKGSDAYAELAALENSSNTLTTKEKSQAITEPKEVEIKDDKKSNLYTVQSDGRVFEKNGDQVVNKELINKVHLKSGFVKYEKISIVKNKKQVEKGATPVINNYALVEDGRVISLNQSSLGKELDVETSSIAKDVLSKGKIHLKEEIKSDNPSISIDSSTLTQDVTEDKPKEKKKFNKNNDSTLLFSSKKISVLPSLNVTETDIEKVRSLFPYEVNIKNLFNIANSDAWATWSQSAITLFKGATRADLYHEAWHHFSQLYLTKDEKVRLYSETRQRVKELVGKSDLEVEEYIAREFAKFTETGKIEGNYPERKSIFQKIMDFLKSIFSNETDLSLDSLFNNLYKGQVNPLNYSTDNIMFGKLNSSINDNFSASETDVLFPALDALKSQLLKEYNVSDSEMYKIKNVNRIYNEIQDHIIELYEKSENPIITSKLEKVLDNWEDVKKSHLEYVAKQKGIKSEVEIDENGQLSFKNENEDEKQGRNSADFSEGSEKTIYDLMDEDVKSLIRGLVDKDSKGNEIVDPVFGLPRLVDFSKYVELLKDSFDDSQDLNQMLEKMTELSKKYPAIKDLIDRLFVNESNDVKNLRIKFVSSLGLVKNPIIQGLVNENKVITAVQASTSKKREAEYDTKAYFYQAKPTSLIESIDGENVIKSTKLEVIKNYNIAEQKDQINFLKDIGIEIDNLLPNLENRDKKLLFNLNTFQYLKDHIVKYLSEKGDIKNIIDALQTTLKDGKKEDKVYKLLVNLKQKRLPQYISGAYLNAANKLEQEKTQWSTMDTVLVALSKSKSIQDLTNDPNLVHLKGFLDGSYLDMQSSKLLSYLYNENGTRTSNKLTKNNYNGIASTDENKDGLKTKTMYIKDKVLMDIALFTNSNHLTTMQLSNKASHFTFGFDKVLIDNETEFVNAMYGYLLDELKIIKEFDNGNEELTKLKKLKGNILKDGKYQFAIFKDIITATENNPDFAQDVINQYLKNGELKEDVRAAVVKQIKDFLNEEVSSTVNFIGADFLAELKVDENNRRYKGLDNRSILKDYIQNQLVFNIEMSKLVFGNPYMHTDPFKRIAGASSTGRSILSDDTSIEYYKQMTTSTQRSKALDILHSKVGGEYKLQTRKSEKEIRYFVAKDREVQSDYYNSILKLTDEQIAKNPDNLELKEKRKAIESAYNKVNGSDAMGACTLDFWRKSSVLSGRWDFKSLEPFYQKMINWDYYNRLMKSTEDSEKKLEYFTERQKNELTDDEIINVAVLKYQYYGTVENNSIAEKAFHKFQLMPLIPQVIEGKNWSNHLDRMIYEDVDYMMFESASKLERDDALDDFYIENSNKSAGFDSSISKYRNGTNSYNIKTGFLDNLKEQVFMENGVDDSLLFGSQVRKLLFNTDDFSDLYDEFRNTIQSLTDIEKDNLKKLSGLDDEGKVTDNQKFVKFLLDEIDKKTVNKNVREYLRLTNEGNFAHSLDTNIQRQPIESIINSVINSRLIKQKMHGEMLVQVSNVGFESLEDGKGLKFYSLENGKVRKMQVKVPLTGKFKNLLNLVIDGQKVGTRERLNQLLKEGKIDTRAITMVGYRIPTQEHNSIEIMEVEEFLHPSLNAIIVPYEITAKAGSDFDIDKLNIFKPHIDENGYYVEKKFNSKSEAVDNYLQTKERINPLIKDIRIEKFNWQSNLVQETERVKKDIFERIQTLKNDLSFYKGQLRDNIVFNAMVYEKNQIINQMYQLFDDYRALRNKEDIGGEYEYKRGNPNYKYKDTLKFTVNKEVREYLNRTNSSFMKALFDEYTDISDETPIYDVKNEIVQEYNDRLSALLNVTIALDAEFINNKDLKNKINELNGTKGYDSAGTFTGVSGEIQNLYSQLNSVFTNSKSAKIFIKGEMPEELKQIYKRVMGYQFELSEELNKLYIDKNQAFLDMVNFKNSNQNKIIEIFDKVLLDPPNYLNLITPNSTFMFDEAMDNIFIARYSADEIQTKKGKKLPKDLNMTRSLTPRSSWITSKILFEAESALGIAAVGNTFTQLIQKSNVEFTESYLKKYNLLFKPESISKRTLSNGLSKATAYSQLINIYVDIANDPRAGYLNMGDRVTPIINTMINMGLPIDTILYFINQPIIRDFVEYEGMIKNSLFKGKEKVNVYKEFIKTVSESSKYDFGSVVKLTKNLEEGYVNYSRFIESKQTYADVSYLLQKEGVEHDFSNENLKSTLREKPNGINREDYSKQQLLLLSQYLQLSEISSDYRQLQSSMNFDTTLAKDGFDSEERERLFNEVVKKGIFTNLGDLKNKTVIAPLNISNYLTNVNKTLLPLTNSTVFYNSLSKKLSTNYQYSTTKVKSRFVRTFKNDLISYIFQNFVTRSDKASLLFNETFAPVLGEYENKPNEFGLYLVKNLYKDLIKLRNENPELKNQYSILDKLFIISENEFKNIGLSYFNKDSQLQDSYIEQFKELLNHQNLEVRNFMLKFAYMSFFQSGLNKSFISSSDIIPAYIFAPILDATREQFYKEVNSPAKENAILEDFFNKFLQNNDRFRANDDNRGKSDKNILKEKSDRGKWYVSNIDEVLNKSKEQPAITEQIDEKQDVEGIEINSYQTGLGNDLTNVHYAKNGKSNFDIIPSNKELILTKEAKAKWGESVEAWYKSNNAQIKGIPEGEQGDKYDFDLMVGLITDKLTQYPNLIQQINERGGLVFLQKSTHTMGTGRWSSKNPKNMFMNSLIQAYKNVVKQSEVNTVEQIYSQLGNQTQSENVILPKDLEDNTVYEGKNFWDKIVPEAKSMFDRKFPGQKPMIIAFRGNGKKSFLQNYKEQFVVGNPFDWQTETGSREEKGIKSTKKFIDWLITGNNFGNANAKEEYRQAIINDIKSGKITKSPILYYEEKDYATHATALDYLINKYDWNQSKPEVKLLEETELVDFFDHNTQKSFKKPMVAVKTDFKSGVFILPNGNFLIKAYRTDDTGVGSKGFGQRGEGLYLSLTNPYPGRTVFSVEFEISPKEIVTYKNDKYANTIPYEKLQKRTVDFPFHKAVKAVGGKAFIGGINGSEDINEEIVIYDETLIEKIQKSKKKVADYTTMYKLYNQPTSEVKPVSGELTLTKKEITKEDTDKLPPCIG